MSKVKGLGELIDKLIKADKRFEQEVKEIVAFNTGEMELEAIRLAPSPGEDILTQFGTESQIDIARGRGWRPISQEIGSFESKDGLSGTVFVNDGAGLIAAYCEFGTGQSAKSYLATVPKEWRDIASKFYINGKGTIIAQPYLLPAWYKQKIVFLKELEALVKNFKL